MVLKWRVGHEHQLPYALSRLPGSQERGDDIDLPFPDDNIEAGPGGEGGPQGTKLDVVLLKELEAGGGLRVVSTGNGRLGPQRLRTSDTRAGEATVHSSDCPLRR